MINNENQLKIFSRSAMNENGLHPFQIQFNNAIADSSNQIILVEAPVGSGKSHIARSLIQSETGGMTVLTFPTKILMEAQLGSLREDLGKDGIEMCVWPHPDSSFREDALNVINYSSDAMMKLLRRDGYSKNLQRPRGELLAKIFDAQSSFSGQDSRAVVTTPDVLHLIAKNRYKAAKRVAAYLSPNRVFVFDEFHLYHNLTNFAPLVETIVKDWKGRIVLLSATPVVSDELAAIFEKYKIHRITFSPDSVADSSTPNSKKRTFNFELNVQIENFKTSNLELWVHHLEKHLPNLEKPLAIILDSVHRVQRLKAMLIEGQIIPDKQLKEWSGLRKDSFDLKEDTIVIGTSAIEVGLNLPFKSLIFEATYWPSAIQRLGRIGRFCEGTAIIFSRQRFIDAIGDKTCWERDAFEQQVLMNALRNPIDSMIGGEMFRGNSYSFVLIDSKTQSVYFYDQAIFSMFEIDDFEDQWQLIDEMEKRERLSEWRVSETQIDEILLRDKIIPFVGAIQGRLRNDYARIERVVETEDSIEIFTDRPYVFDKPDIEGFSTDVEDLFDDEFMEQL